MNEIICPHCHKAFKVDEAGYADILKQVRDAEFEQQLHDRLELAEKEKQCQLLATELQSTRRRVNVLEHVVIPDTQETIKYINDKLGEAERDEISRLMKIADTIRG